jgi:hypothetical protein
MTPDKTAIGNQTRMLCSHNFDITNPAIPPLSREKFTEIFLTAFAGDAHCQLIDNPHWIFELKFDGTRFTPQQIGDRIVQALAEARQSTVAAGVVLPHTLSLGGLKQSPATNPSPSSLQPNEWGVDVVETVNADAFLAGLNWEATIAAREPGTIFQSILKPI